MDLEAIAQEGNRKRSNEGYCGSLYLIVMFGACMENKPKSFRHLILAISAI